MAQMQNVCMHAFQLDISTINLIGRGNYYSQFLWEVFSMKWLELKCLYWALHSQKSFLQQYEEHLIHLVLSFPYPPRAPPITDKPQAQR